MLKACTNTHKRLQRECYRLILPEDSLQIIDSLNTNERCVEFAKFNIVFKLSDGVRVTRPTTTTCRGSKKSTTIIGGVDLTAGTSKIKQLSE